MESAESEVEAIKRPTNEIIRGLREDQDLKQVDIADVLGISQQTYSNYETGGSELPLRHLIKLCDYYQVTSDYLLGKVTYKRYVSDLDQPLIGRVTVGDFLSHVRSLDKKSLWILSYFVEFLLGKQKAVQAKSLETHNN